MIEQTELVFVISDPNQEDNPIIYVNKGFTQLTGYEYDEVVGRNCRFLQGPDTDKQAVETVREAIRKKEEVSVQILNYKKDGSTFWNLLHIDPTYVESEGQYYFVGIQKDVTEYRAQQEKLDSYYQEIELLSTPLVPITDDVSILPIIGNIDERRMNVVIERILPQIEKSEIDILIVDLSSFADIDEAATVGIFQLKDLLKLKGVTMLIAGVTPKVAMKARGLDIDLSSLRSYGSVKQALEAIDKLK
ncbi:PAS domain-containing protein [Paenalkalicoccus suaedae]|uniref:PAS domain-containing protein n=1 Tax=Paenalkalicoccus suaedae TaxID=2592382 RepID=A0A859FAA3_9BACI|nr:PAS domain-containing protein [Paenalkalicoccus suaedae]